MDIDLIFRVWYWTLVDADDNGYCCMEKRLDVQFGREGERVEDLMWEWVTISGSLKVSLSLSLSLLRGMDARGESGMLESERMMRDHVSNYKHEQ